MEKQGSFFFGTDELYEKLSDLGDPLEVLSKRIPWDKFANRIKLCRMRKARKSNAGRKPYSDDLMFKLLVLQALYDLSDEQLEYQVRDRLSFKRFLGLDLTDKVPDCKTVWVFREFLIQNRLLEKLFDRFNRHLDEQGFLARSGQIVDASIIQVPRQRNSRDENALIKEEGAAPGQWSEAKRRQKDIDARWVTKHGQRYFGYKNHVSVDVHGKFIRCFSVGSADEHDSQRFNGLIDPDNSSADVYADSAYRSRQISEELKSNGYRNKIHHRAYRNKPLTENQKRVNKQRSKIRARVEHVFASIKNRLTTGVRTVGLRRAEFKIGMMNLTYNMNRLMLLERRISPS